MNFVSVEYLILFLLIFILNYRIGNKARSYILLFASWFFYAAWKPSYIFILLASTIIDYTAARQMEKNHGNSKKFWLASSLIVNLGLLGTFKYLDFFLSSMMGLTSFFGLHLSIPYANLFLPIGISFYTFQTMSYSIDVYLGKIKAEKNFVWFATYVSFFPQLVAGPIERAGNLLPQLKQTPVFDYENVSKGLFRILWGYFKKIVIASTLQKIVDSIFIVDDASGLSYFITAFLFIIQMYCDFSAYADIAIGTGQTLGIHMQENFKNLMMVRKLSDFWRRWHITFGSFLKDYVYIPLGGNQCSKSRNILNILIVFLLSGLWHGANWTYVIAFSAIGILIIMTSILNNMYKKVIHNSYPKIENFLGFVFMFVSLTLCVIMFRSKTTSQGFYILNTIILDIPNIFDINYIYQSIVTVFGTVNILVKVIIIILILYIYERMNERSPVTERIRKLPSLFRHTIYILLVLAIIFFGQLVTVEAFIYFAF